MTVHFRTTRRVEQPASTVWAVLIDFESYAQWNPMVERAGGLLATGRALTLKLRRLPFPVQAQIRRLEPGRELRWGGGVPLLLDIEHYFQVIPEGDDAALFVHGEIFSGLLGPLVTRLAGINDGDYEHFNDKLAEQATRL